VQFHRPSLARPWLLLLARMLEDDGTVEQLSNERTYGYVMST